PQKFVAISSPASGIRNQNSVAVQCKRNNGVDHSVVELRGHHRRSALALHQKWIARTLFEVWRLYQQSVHIEFAILALPSDVFHRGHCYLPPLLIEIRNTPVLKGCAFGDKHLRRSVNILLYERCPFSVC